MAQGSLRASVENKLCARSFLCCSMRIDSDDDVYVAQAEMTERKDAYLGVLRAGQLKTLAALRAWSLRKKAVEKDKPVNAWDEHVEQAHQDALRTLRGPATRGGRRTSKVVDARPSRISSRPPLSKEDVQTFFGKGAWENTPETAIYFLLHVSCLIAFF